MTQEEISKIIEEYTLTYQSSLDMLEDAYSSLQKAREQLPLKFLTKTGIEHHIKKVASFQDKYIKKLYEKKVKLKSEHEELAKKFQESSNKEEKYTLKQEASTISDKTKNLDMQIEKLNGFKLESSPERVLYFYEDLLLFVSAAKHEARELWKFSMALHDDISLDVDYIEAKLLLDVSEDFLKLKFTKVSEALRKAFVNAQKDFKELKKILAKAKALQNSSKKLLDNFEIDEVNYRKFAERKTLNGSF